MNKFALSFFRTRPKGRMDVSVSVKDNWSLQMIFLRKRKLDVDLSKLRNMTISTHCLLYKLSTKTRGNVHWGVNTPSKTPPLFLFKPPSPLNLQSVQALSPFRQLSLYWFFVNPLPLKNWIFQWTPKILKFFIHNPIPSQKGRPLFPTNPALKIQLFSSPPFLEIW